MTLLFGSLWYDDEAGKGGGGGGGGASPKGYAAKSGGAHVGKVNLPRQGVPKSGARPTRCVIKTKYIKAGANAGGSIARFTKYVIDREYGPNEEKRYFFDREGRDYDKADVIMRMKEQQGEDRAMYTFTIAPSGNDLDQTEFTRKFMERFEEHLGVQVDWIAITHKNTEHHHIHLLMAGRIPEQDRDLFNRHMEGQDIYFHKEDFDKAREIATEELYKARGREHEYELNKYVERELDLKWDDKVPRDVVGKDYITDLDRSELYGLFTNRQNEEAIGELRLGGYVDGSTDIMGYSDREDDLYRSLFENENKRDESADETEVSETCALDPFDGSEEESRSQSLDGAPGSDDRDGRDDDEERFARGER